MVLSLGTSSGPDPQMVSVSGFSGATAVCAKRESRSVALLCSSEVWTVKHFFCALYAFGCLAYASCPPGAFMNGITFVTQAVRGLRFGSPPSRVLQPPPLHLLTEFFTCSSPTAEAELALVFKSALACWWFLYTMLVQQLMRHSQWC